ncbi:MAG: diphthine--ammonia ligase [Candidatus Woesearchaeota archaeon]|nr:diphthine--ammonia ligase [Candidatus Woesearchaeota archaeon]
MCGIIGIFNNEDSLGLVKKGLTILKERGKDGTNLHNEDKFTLGHTLHSVVGSVKQPIQGKFVSNCEIYNWETLNKYKAKNDSELLFKILEEKGIKALDDLDGVYSFAYKKGNKLYLARDIIGIKPVWYSHNNGFSFASEKKVLEKLGFLDINELNPRKILIYNIKENKIEFIERPFFDITHEIKDNKDKIIEQLNKLLTDSIRKRIPKRKFGLLFSGGIDSTLIAFILKKLGHRFTCYTAALDDPNMEEPKDLQSSKKVAKELGLDLKIIRIKLKDIEKHLKTIIPLIEDSNVVKAGVALTFYAACKQAKKGGCKVIFSGLGSEEIFAGYERHKNSLDINKECVSGLLKMYERDTYRDDVITMHNNLELRVPFLDKSLIEYSLRIPASYKINDSHKKVILRELAEKLKIKKEFAWRKKIAAQYGSKFDRGISKLTKKAGLKYKSEYLRRFYPEHNLRLAALVSGGKDSIYATYVMKRQNYDISCLVSIKSKNPDSYMFHTPNIDIVKLQSKAMDIPLIEQATEGKKELELKDFEKALKKAKKEYNVEGVITGALFSNYQRERIERVADKLSLKIFSPLWHLNQETEMKEILEKKFEIVFSSIAAEGLDENWLRKKITEKDLNKLIELNKKIRLNVAGEGGEFESLVLDCPLFSKKIKIISSEVVKEDENTARLAIKKAELVDK